MRTPPDRGSSHTPCLHLLGTAPGQALWRLGIQWKPTASALPPGTHTLRTSTQREVLEPTKPTVDRAQGRPCPVGPRLGIRGSGPALQRRWGRSLTSSGTLSFSTSK